MTLSLAKPGSPPYIKTAAQVLKASVTVHKLLEVTLRSHICKCLTGVLAGFS
jgi:hypothetical protein